jgi:hypothetical protein
MEENKRRRTYLSTNTYNISADEQQLLCIQLRNKTSFSAKGKHNNID